MMSGGLFQFVFNSRTCFIRNKLSSLKLEMVDIDGNVQVDNIGSYETGTGKVSLVGFNPTTIEGGSTLKIYSQLSPISNRQLLS